jgi:Domain of unknown function DUF29
MPSTRAVKVPGKPRRRVATESSYERDFYAWTVEQARALRTRRPEKLDWENLAEEIESLGRSDRRQVRSRLEVILMHLLKWQLQIEHRSISWKTTINSQRYKLELVLADSPSLRRQVPVLLVEAYPRARRSAAAEMDLIPAAARKLPETSPFTVEQVLDEEFFPD